MTHRMTPGAPCQYVTYNGQVWGAIIAAVYVGTEAIPEGTVDLVVFDPIMLCPQPARLVAFMTEEQAAFDGADARHTWHWID